MNGKFLTFFTILVVLLATIVSSVPFERRKEPVMHVTSPGEGPWARKSIQVVSWWCNECDSHDDVTVQIMRYRPGSSDVEMLKKNGKNAFNGSLQFKIGSNWDVTKKFYAKVTLKRDSKVVDRSVKFRIFKTSYVSK